MVDAPDYLPAVVAALLFWADETPRTETGPKRLALAPHYDISINVARTLEILFQAASAASTSGRIRNT